MKRYFSVQIVLLLLIYSVLATVFVITTKTHAYNQPSWLTGLTIDAVDYPEDRTGELCKNANIKVVDFNEPNQGSILDTVGCVAQAKDYTLARYEVNGSYGYGIKRNSDTSYRLISGLGLLSRPLITPYSNRLVYLGYTGGSAVTTLTVIEDTLGSLITIRSDLSNNPVLYELRTEEAIYPLSYDYEDRLESMNVYSYAMSSNGIKLLVWAEYKGHIKIDLNTGKRDLVSLIPGLRNGGISNPYVGAITNDGNFGFINNGPMIIDMRNCGHDISDITLKNGLSFQVAIPPCSVSLSGVQDLLGFAGYQDINSPFEWLGDEDGLRFAYRGYPDAGGAEASTNKLITLWKSKPPAQDIHKLEYLALGDSYSSGEGDTAKQSNGQSFYLPGTSSEGECHISTRSYPVELARLNSVLSGRMQSVACSGAQVTKDYFGNGQTYMGQGNKLKGMSDDDINYQRYDALAEFRPGILKQVDFVNANKPKVVTLTGGGNDVGFGKIMTYCAHIIHEKKLSGTCDYAKKGSKLHGVLANSIKGQYDHTLNLIDSIKAASPQTSVYVVGYPSFVASKFGCVNDGALNRSEIEMLNESILYMNKILESAARLKGVHYVNVHDSFVGGRICEGGLYVTGPESLLHGAMMQEVFHPNAAGNARLAEVIMSSGFTLAASNNPLEDRAVSEPSMPSYFAGSSSVATRHEQLIANPKTKRGQTVVMATEKSVFRSSSKVTAMLYSQPIKIGSYSAAADGSLNEALVIPANTAPGLHVLLLEGIGSNGEPIAIYQFIEVSNLGSNDLDGDGIKNDKDLCPYIKVWYDESTKQDVCNSDTVKSLLKEGLGLGHQRHEGKDNGEGHWRD